MSDARPALILLSGGLDSATVLAIAKDAGFACHTLAIDYRQRHRHELEASAKVAHQLGAVSHKIVPLDLRAFGGSALTADIDVPKDRDEATMSDGVPITYVPARNLVFLSLACAYAETLACDDVFIGVNAIDYSGYPDCRPQFVRSFEETANLATKAGTEGHHLTIHAPLSDMSKAAIIRRGVGLGVDYALTHSCYDPDESGAACASCDSCLLRKAGFAQAGLDDPTIYTPAAR